MTAFCGEYPVTDTNRSITNLLLAGSVVLAFVLEKQYEPSTRTITITIRNT